MTTFCGIDKCGKRARAGTGYCTNHYIERLEGAAKELGILVLKRQQEIAKIKDLGPGVELIRAERQKQIDKHGFTGKHHAEHPEWYDNEQLQFAAVTLLMHEIDEVVDVDAVLPDGWDIEWFRKLNAKPRKERLIIAAALIAAELDRIQEP